MRVLVTLDVEPGGTSKPKADIGVAEVDDEGRISAKFQVGFASPHCDGAETLRHVFPQVGQTFAEVWPFIDAFIGDRTVAVHGSGYDASALVGLLSCAGVAPPDVPIVCSLHATRRTLGKGGCGLQGLVLHLGLFTPEEIERRRAHGRFYDVNKWLLHNAQDDAEACARLMLRLASESHMSLAAFVDVLPQRSLNSYRPRQLPRPHYLKSGPLS